MDNKTLYTILALPLIRDVFHVSYLVAMVAVSLTKEKEYNKNKIDG